MVKFLVTSEAQRLARWLRLLGYDTVLAPQGTVSELVVQASGEGRVLVSRWKALDGHRGASVVVVKGATIDGQLRDVVRQLKLKPTPKALFSRCSRCNLVLEPVAKAGVRERVPSYVFETQDRFLQCAGCRQIYWAGTHRERAEGFVKKLARA